MSKSSLSETMDHIFWFMLTSSFICNRLPNYSQLTPTFVGLVGLYVSSQQVAVEHSFALLGTPHAGDSNGKRPIFGGALNAETADPEIYLYLLRKYLIFDRFSMPYNPSYGFERFSRRDIYDAMINRRQSYNRRCSHQIQIISNMGTSRSFSKSQKQQGD